MSNTSNDLTLCLRNGLTLHLVELPPKHTMCNVSLAVGAGYFHDPQDCPGLSHLLEHTMFMGSENYPLPNAVIDELENLGGTLNAWTSMEHANYHLSVEQANLTHALKILLHFVTKPLFNAEAIAGEINNIDAEFKEKQLDELRKVNDVIKSTCNPNHPFSRFSVGNKEIFSQFTTAQLVSMLRDFHGQRYCAANMALCISTSQPVHALLRFLEQESAVLLQGSIPHSRYPSLYLPSQCGVKIAIKTLQLAHRLIVTFDIGNINDPHIRAHVDYLSHLIGDEGSGSIIAALRSAQLANNLIVGTGTSGRNFCDFNINIQLSELGQSQVEKVTEVVFYTLNKIAKDDGHEWRFNEKQQLNNMAREYSDHVYSIDTICEFAEQLLTNGTINQHIHTDFQVTFSPSTFNTLLAKCTPKQGRVINISPWVDTNSMTNYYQTQYSCRPLGHLITGSNDENVLVKSPLVKTITLPKANIYLCNEQDLTLTSITQGKPIRLPTNEFESLWFAQDDIFHVPRGDIYIALDCEPLVTNITMTAAKRVWLELINQQLKEQFYSAEIAGLKYHLYGHQAGFTLHTSGFAAKQRKLCEDISRQLMTFNASTANFTRARESQIALQQNALYNKPINRLFARLSSIIQLNSPVTERLSSALEKLAIDDIEVLPSTIRSAHASEFFLHGNWVENDALHLYTSLREIFGAATHPPISRETALLPVGEMLYHEVECQHPDAAVVLYLQAPNASMQHTAQCMVLEQMLAAPFFSSLRTEKQIGYSVATGFAPYNKHPGIAFQVQSPNLSTQEIVDEIVKFLFAQLNELEFYEQYWPHIKRNLLRQLLDTDLTFAMKSQRYWTNLTQDIDSFNRNAGIANVIRNLTFNDIYSYAEQVSKRQVFGELVVYSKGNKPRLNKPYSSIIDNIDKFKHQHKVK